jgi:hypothetical protein
MAFFEERWERRAGEQTGESERGIDGGEELGAVREVLLWGGDGEAIDGACGEGDGGEVVDF